MSVNESDQVAIVAENSTFTLQLSLLSGKCILFMHSLELKTEYLLYPVWRVIQYKMNPVSCESNPYVESYMMIIQNFDFLMDK